MIPDRITNLVCISHKLSMYKSFYRKLLELFNRLEISYRELDVESIWVRDFMPIQVSRDKFVSFLYQPSYLRKKPNLDIKRLCDGLVKNLVFSEIVLDGGNVVKAEKKVIMTDRIFYENKGITKKALIKKLYELLGVEKIIIIPAEEEDIFGHSDGLCRFYNDDCVIVQYPEKGSRRMISYRRNLEKTLASYGLEIIWLPANYRSDDEISAKGCYINFLQVGNSIVLPLFGLKSDERVLEFFNSLYPPPFRIETILSSSIANQGGVLNCITWSLKPSTLLLKNLSPAHKL